MDLLQVSARRPLRLYGVEVIELNVWRPLVAHIEEQLAPAAACIVEVDAFYLPDTAGTSLSHRARQDDDRHPGARCARRGGSVTSTTPAITSSAATISPACSGSQRAPTDPEYLPPYVEVAKLGGRPQSTGSGTRARVARAAARPISLGGLHDNPFRRYAVRFAADLEWLAGGPLRTFPWLCLRHVPAVRRGLRARRGLPPVARRQTASAASNDSRRPATSSPRPPRLFSSGPRAS